MRIIKAAKKIDEYIATCNNCGSILGLKRTDLSNGTMIDDSQCDNWTYYCEVCHCYNHINGTLHKLFPWTMEEEINDGKISNSNALRKY